VTRLLNWETHTGLDDTQAFLEAVAAGWAAGDEYCWVLEYGPDARVIGTVGASFDEHGAEIGYVLARAYWGCGLAAEAARAVFAAIREIDGIYRVWAVCDIDNTASARVLEKIGLRYEARLMRWSECPNHERDRRPRDVLVYAWVC
jgi:ribosomal-protein-alanine N-acetyltransferase